MAVKSSFVFFLPTTPITTTPRCSKLKSPRVKITAFSCSDLQYDIDNSVNKKKSPIKRSHGESMSELSLDSFWSCSCGRRRFIEATTTSTALAMFPICPSNASNLHSDDYMVGEAIPLSDASVDAVVGTLVLCSVKDVDMTLREVKRVLRPGGVYLFVEHVAAKDGTVLRFVQSVLDPLQQTLADGCHLTRKTGMKISESGFSGVELSMASLSNAFFINPQIYGLASK